MAAADTTRTVVSRWRDTSRGWRLVFLASALMVLLAACGGGASETDAADDTGETTTGETTTGETTTGETTTGETTTGETTTGETASASPDPASTGGTAETAGGGGRVGFAWTDPAFDVFGPIQEGAEDAAAERGYELLISNNGGDIAQQLADIQTWIGQEVEALTILPLDPAATAPLAQEAIDAGIVVVGYGDQIEGNDGYITFDNDQGAELLGNAAAAWINETLGGEAEVALLTNDTQETARERIDGAEERILDQTEATVVGRVDAAGSADAYPAVQSLLVANPNLNVVLCVADDGCLGAAQAFEEAGRDPQEVYLAGWDGSRLVLEAIQEDSYIKASAALDLYNIGRAVIEVPANALEGSGETELNMEYVLADQEHADVVQRLIDAYGE